MNEETLASDIQYMMPDTEAIRGVLLRRAAKHGLCEIVSDILLNFPETPGIDEAIDLAAFYGHTRCLRSFVEITGIDSIGHSAVQWAAKNGHAECVRMLIPITDTETAKTLLRADGHDDAANLLSSIDEELRLRGRSGGDSSSSGRTSFV